MWSQPAPINAGLRPGYATSLAAREWALLVRLPSRMLAVLITTFHDPPTVDAGLAGLAVIAGGRTARGPAAGLVREVVVAIFASDERSAGTENRLDPDTLRSECAAAGQVLAQRVPSAAAAAYREWLRRVGATVLTPERPADDPIGGSQVDLLADCERALAG